jgi:GT2 family glycosyltransferase
VDRQVLAVVLTHDAPGAPARCLDAIDRQTRPCDAVLVVDNASDPPVVLPHRSVDVVRSDLNTGPGGGHELGLRRFLDSGAALAWVMDDDCVPAPTCLEALLRHDGAIAGARPVFPCWIDGPTGAARFLPAWCGVLIPRAMVERVGLPRADFVWWAEDTEYFQQRIWDHGMRAEEAGDAVVEHHRVRNRSRKPAWKFYYEARNTIVYRWHVQDRTWHHSWLGIRSLVGLLGQLLFTQPITTRDVQAYARGVFDGLTNRTGLRVPLRS